MIIFDAEQIELAIGPYLSYLQKITLEAFRDFQRIRVTEGINYDPWHRASLIRNHFKDKLEKSDLIDGEKITIVPRNNTFFININGYPVTFNKLKKDRSKSKYIDDINMNIAYNFNQLKLFVNSALSGKKFVSEEIPLTFGYVLNSIGTEITGYYLTYQVGRKVEWYKKVEFEQPIIITSPPDDDGPRKARITIK